MGRSLLSSLGMDHFPLLQFFVTFPQSSHQESTSTNLKHRNTITGVVTLLLEWHDRAFEGVNYPPPFLIQLRHLQNGSTCDMYANLWSHVIHSPIWFDTGRTATLGLSSLLQFPVIPEFNTDIVCVNLKFKASLLW